MTDPESGDIFDVRNFHRLVELMREHDLNEVDLKRGDSRIRLRRGQQVVHTTMSAPQMHAPVASAPPVSAPAKAADAPRAADDKSTYIKSPTVGTYYAAPSPDAPPCVKIGDQVGPETVVCIIEAMKVFNEIPAELSGKIVAILVENGDPVEFGQPLFKIEPRG
jgi:acetyl-CoA carboxylase biotin carboxyl carrier protein